MIIRALLLIIVLTQISSCSKHDPSVDSSLLLTPSFGSSGRKLLIKSNHDFTGDISDHVVKFSKANGHVISVSGNSMLVRVPDNAGSGPITVISNGVTTTGPTFEYITPAKVEYFARFKDNGVFVEGIVQSYTTLTENCSTTGVGDCGQLMFYVQGHFKEAIFEVNFDHNNTSSTLSALKGVTMLIRPKSKLPAVSFTFNTINGTLTSDDAAQTGTLKITNITYHNSAVSDYDIYDVEGTFECVIYDKIHDQTSVISEGTFRIPFAAVAD